MKAKILATLLALLTLAGCGGGEGEYVGIYRSGSSDYDAYVELRDDGTAYYSQRSLRSGDATSAETTWELEDGKIVVKANDAIRFDISADARDPDVLFFRAPGENWQENAWTRQG